MATSYILYDIPEDRENLLPLTFTRPLAEIRVGILTLREKWEFFIKKKISWKSEKYLSAKFPMVLNDENIFVNSSLIANAVLVEAVNQLKPGESLWKENLWLASCVGEKHADTFNPANSKEKKSEFSESVEKVGYPWDIFLMNGEEIENDFILLTQNRKSQNISNTNQVFHRNQVFIEEGARVECSVLNAEYGPIYIGKDAEIMEGALIRGPFALGEHSSLKMGAKIYGATTIGPDCKVGGEVNNSVIFAHSNKAHDGFLGNAVIGEWCNLGADTNNSNLKNNYAEVKLWNYRQEKFLKSGQQFAGLIMGDHSKCGINTMFNTGTVVGVSANVFGSGFPRNFIPSFSWGGAHGFTVYGMQKVFETAAKVFSRRNLSFNEQEQNILSEIFTRTEKYRKF